MNDRARRLLLGVFVLGLVGLIVELLLLGHDEDMIQSIPLVLAGLALASGAHVGVSRAAVAVRGSRIVMSLFLLGGVVGSALHFRANVEFQQEMEPGMSGLTLV